MASSRPIVSPSSSTLIALRSSSCRRDQALTPETDFSVKIFSSGSERRYGRNFLSERSQWRQRSSSEEPISDSA